MPFGDSDNMHSDSFFDSIRTSFRNMSVRKPGRKRIWPALALLTGGLILTLAVSLLLKKDIETKAKTEFDFACADLNNKISARLHAHAQLLRSGVAFLMNSDEITRDEWRNFYVNQMIEKNLPEVQGIGYSIIIPQDQLARHEKEIQSEGFPQYSVRPAGKREIYTSIIYLEPFSGRNLRAFGHDMFSEPVCRKAMETARDYNIVALSGKVTLVQETNEDTQAGTLMVVPVYKKGMPTETVEERRHAIKGWAYMPYRMNDMMAGITGSCETNRKHIHLKIFDNPSHSRNSLLYDSRKETNKHIISHPVFSLQTSVPFNGCQWYLSFTQYGSGETGPDYSKAWITAAGGTGFSILLFVVLLLLINTNIKANQLAGELTRDLRESETKYSSMIANISDVVCIIGKDGMFKYISPNIEKWFGWQPQDLTDTNGWLTIHPDDLEHIQKEFFTLPEKDNPAKTVECRYKCKDGSYKPISLTGTSLINDSIINGVLINYHDITSRKKIEAGLEKTRKELAAIKIIADEAGEFAENTIDTVREPLIVLDQELRVVKASRSFYDFFKVSPEETIGKLIYDLGNRQWNIPELRELLETILPEETTFDNYEVEQDFYAVGKRIMLLNARQIQQKPGGKEKIILLAIEDITERKKIEAGLEKTRKELAAIKIIADEAGEFAENTIDTVREPLIVLDQELRVVKASRSFYDFFKVSPEETIGKLIYDLGNRQWNIPKLRELLETILPEKTTFDNYEVEHDFYAVGKRIMLLNARQIKSKTGGKEKIILLAIEDITERRQTAKADMQLRESYLSAVIENQPGLLWLKDPDGRILFANSKYLDALGLDKHELIVGKTDFDLWPRGLADKYTEEDLRVAETKETMITEDHILDNGRIKWSETFKSPVIDNQGIVIGTTGYSVDITGRKQAEEALKKSIQRLELAMNTADMAWWEIELPSGNITFGERKAEMLGFPPERFKHYTDFTDLVHPDDYARIMDTVHNIICGIVNKYETEYRILNKGNEYRWVYDTGSVAETGVAGMPVKITGLVLNITDRKEAQIELTELNINLQISNMQIEENLIQERMLVEDLTGTREMLEKINSEKDRFFSIIAHDLKGPFQGFIGLTELLAEDVASFSQNELSEIAHEMHITAKNLFALLNNLLEWARMQQGAISFEPVETDLSETVSRNIDIISTRGKQKGIEIINEAGRNRTVKADKEMLNTVLRNLLSNAVKFTRQGGKVIVRATEAENNMMVISVTDSGIGMSETLSQRLFKIDEKTGRKGTDDEPSTGLGLLLCKEFVERHGGRIQMESVEGKGTIFYFTIPAIQQVPPPVME